MRSRVSRACKPAASISWLSNLILSMRLFPGKFHEFSSYPRVCAAVLCKTGSSFHSKYLYLAQARDPAKKEVKRADVKSLNCMFENVLMIQGKKQWQIMGTTMIGKYFEDVRYEHNYACEGIDKAVRDLL